MMSMFRALDGTPGGIDGGIMSMAHERGARLERLVQ